MGKRKNDFGKLQPDKTESEYADTDELREIFANLKGKKYVLDCGHKVTFGFFLANNIVVLNGKRVEIICSECSY